MYRMPFVKVGKKNINLMCVFQTERVEEGIKLYYVNGAQEIIKREEAKELIEYLDE